MNLNRFVCIAVLVIILTVTAFTQTMNLDSLATDSLSVQADSLLSRSPRGAMLRSLVVPGWGQFYNGKWFKGLVIGGAELGLMIDGVVQNQLAQQSNNIYDKEYYRENRSLAVWWLAGVVLYSITDAFVDAHLADFDDKPDVSMDIKQDKDLYLNKQYAVYQLTLKFPL